MEPWIVAGAALGVALIVVAWAFFRQTRLVQRTEAAESRSKSVDVMLSEANDALLLIDTADGNVIEWNRAAAELLGYPADAYRNLTIFQLHPPEMLQTSSERIADVWEQGGLVYQDLPLRRADGTLVPVECSARVVRFADRASILIYARDITERLRLEAEVRHQSEIIEEKNRDLTDSIVYARRIQESILPETHRIQAILPNSFVFYSPKDIVSGDFYWFAQVQDGPHSKGILAAADCTGHGVPGAFMSMVGSTLLTEIVSVKHIIRPDLVLNELNPALRKMLKQDEKEDTALDGMDIALCAFDPANRVLEFAGAMRPLLIAHPGADGTVEVERINSDRQPIGGHRQENETPFTLHRFELQPGDVVYLFTDGFTDQFGGTPSRKFTMGRLTRLIQEVATLPMSQQGERLRQAFLDHKGDHEQTDDVMILGVKM